MRMTLGLCEANRVDPDAILAKVSVGAILRVINIYYKNIEIDIFSILFE